MKKSSFYLTAMLSACVLLSCSKEAEAPVTPEEPEIPAVQGDFIISASSGPVRKTELDGERYITWKSGDAISVWEAGNSSNSNVQLSLDASTAGERIGKFSGTLTPASDNFKLYSIYPYSSSYASDPSAVSVSLPSSVGQVTDVNGLVGVSDFMLGAADLSSEDSEYEMLFTYPLAILDIVVSGQGSCLSEAVAESVTITANTAFVGNATVDLTTGTLTPSDADAGKSLVVTYPSTAAISSAQHAWVAIYPVDLTDASCCFDLKMTNGQEIKFNVNPKKAFEAQKIYTINLTDIDTHVDAGEASPIFFDLVGANGGLRANCYIVSEGGYYRFAAQKVDKTNVFEGFAPNSDGYRANWLWSEGASTLVDFVSIGNSGNINFRVQAGARGNALLALFDSSSKIIWSWHIWMTDPDILEPTHWSRNSAWSLANCNIGALSNEEGDLDSYGLYYQWGRKDAMPGYTTYFPSDGFNPGGAGKVSYATAIQNPGVHYCRENGAPQDQSGWCSTSYGNVWSAQTSGRDNDRFTYKTVYDPSPAGVHVPGSYLLTMFTYNKTYNWYFDNDVTTNVSIASYSTAGINFYTSPAKDATIFFPVTGIWSDNGEYEKGHAVFGTFGNGGHYWMTQAHTPGTALALFFNQTKIVCRNGDSFNQAHACAIRPEKE